jgi:aminoglycoside phosphotransferase
LKLERYGIGRRIACVLLTPRFRASSHVLALVLKDGCSEPALVAKNPRLPGADASIEKEAANLREIHAKRRRGFDSIPRVVALEDFGQHAILVETALVGRALDPPYVRLHRDACCNEVLNWLAAIQHPHRRDVDHRATWFRDLVERPLHEFANVFPMTFEEGQLLDQSWQLVEPLRTMDLPFVVEHGDLSSPNVMRLKDGLIGVVDWELAELDGLPAADIFFFLSYVAFALGGARESGRYTPAFHAAFFGHSPWARPYVTKYAGQLGLRSESIRPLFVLCWLRYMTALLSRINQRETPSRSLDDPTAEWLRQNRYYALWRHTLQNVDALNLS